MKKSETSNDMTTILRTFVMLIACFNSVVDCSNSCTRLDFEQKMLEKMVLLEHTMNITITDVDTKWDKISTENVKFAESHVTFKASLKEEMKTLKDDMAEDMRALKAAMTQEMEDFKTYMAEEMKKFKDDIAKEMKDYKSETTQEMALFKKNTSASIKQQTTAQEKFTRDVSKEYKKMMDQSDEKLLRLDEKLQSKTQELQDKLQNDPVAFLIRADKGSNSVNGNLLPFNREIINVGHAFNISDWTFTAPVSGAYMLSAQVCISNIVPLCWRIQTSRSIFSASRYGQRGYTKTCTSVTTVAVLERGEKVFVESTCGNTIALTTDKNGYWSMFSGALLQQVP